MSPAASYRGQPLVALLLLLGGWVMVRTLVWSAAGPEYEVPQHSIAARAQDHPASGAPPSRDTEPAKPGPRPELPIGRGVPHFAPAPVPAPMSVASGLRRDSVPVAPLRPAMRSAPMPQAPASPVPEPVPVPVQVSAGHQLLWMAALARMPLPPGLLARGEAFDRDPRWSADGWLLLRRAGTVSPAGGLAPATYGASQLGAVARYRLAPQSPHRPALYLRGSAALNGSREREAAFGVSARPIAGLPVAVAAEARVNGQPSGTRVRPAAFAYTELPPVSLPLGARAEFYGQAGYVGGNFASAFADGQLRIDRRVLRLGRGELRAGGGAWGGAQKGASRLDLGPAATLGMPLGGSGSARLGVDWRFRVAGNAAPASGPVLTLSAGF